MDLNKFYDRFHSTNSEQEKVISENNYTYSQIIKIIRRYKPLIKGHTVRVLDYGSGVGVLDLFLAKNMSMEIVGLDISSRAVYLASSSARRLGLNSKVRFHQLNGIPKQLLKERFDLVLCLEVLEHVKDHYGLVNWLVKRLKSRGLLIVSVPSANAPLYRLGISTDFDHKVGHLRRYTRLSILRLVKSTGVLKVLSIKRTEGIIRNSLFLLPKLGFLIRFIRGPLVGLLTLVDNVAVILFGESDLILVAKKK